MPPRAMSPLPAPEKTNLAAAGSTGAAFHSQAWQGQRQWHALETDFGNGERFLSTCMALKQDVKSPTRLFFTAFCEHPPQPQGVLRAASLHSPFQTSFQELAQALSRECRGLLPGVHRLVFMHGRVQLNLCIGDAAKLWKEIDFAADSIDWQPAPGFEPLNLARLSRRGTVLSWPAHVPVAHEDMAPHGFEILPQTPMACYHPSWPFQTNLRTSTALGHGGSSHHEPPHVVVVGAGLAGSAAAASLAQRGWHVQVLDAGPGLGAGASGLPAGIFATHVSADDNVLSRITRDGVRATWQRAQDLLMQGTDWQQSGLLEHLLKGQRKLPTGDQWPAQGHEWSSPASPSQVLAAGLPESNAVLWHAMAGWMRPQSLIQAQLKTPGITLQTSSPVAGLQKSGNMWLLWSASEELLAQAEHVILANGFDCQALLDSVMPPKTSPTARRLPATALRGQVSFGAMRSLSPALQTCLPHAPVNGHGSYIGGVPMQLSGGVEDGWIVGSSFQRDDLDTQVRQLDQTSNQNQWAELLPLLSTEILAAFETAQTQAWAGVRATLPDRLPAVGPMQNPAYQGISLCTGMGARGISWSVLCGELNAAWLNQEPLPMAASLARLMAASRYL